MERISEVILRNRRRLGPGPLLLINPPRDSLFQALSSQDRSVLVSTQDHGDYRWLAASGAQVIFEVLPSANANASTVILNLPREKERLGMILHSVSSWLPAGARLWLVGENKAGIKSSPRQLKKYFDTISRLDSARHCGLFEASGPVQKSPFNLSAYETAWSIEFSGETVNAISLPGVFAHGRLDKGSKLLLKNLESIRPQGKVLDFACGSGVIGISLLQANPQIALTLLDVSSLALESSRRSLQANGLQAELLASDGLAGLEGSYDWIVSNPPFHRGIKNELEISGLFFRQAGTFLTQNGKILIVCNKHLPYEKWLHNNYNQVSRLDANNEFMIIQAGQPVNP
jgi:16S rRNA (guanine1207-N2)-methyltransferase